MFERFTQPARTTVTLAQKEARRLGHSQITTPHLLLALLRADPGATGEALRTHGVDAEAVERELGTLLGKNPTADLDDAEILAALGIDVARIRATVEASFGPGALDRALDDADAERRGLLGRLTGGRLTGGRLTGGRLTGGRRTGRGVGHGDELAALRIRGRRPSGTSRSAPPPRRPSSSPCARRSAWATAPSTPTTWSWACSAPGTAGRPRCSTPSAPTPPPSAPTSNAVTAGPPESASPHEPARVRRCGGTDSPEPLDRCRWRARA